MAGIHEDRGDRTHKIVSGEKPSVGMYLWDNELNVVRLTQISTSPDGECGWYCKGWHDAEVVVSWDTKTNTGRRTSMNCDRLSSRHPSSGKLAADVFHQMELI